MIDRRGVLGFPIRLGIAFLIIALFIPSVVTALQHYTEESDVQMVRSEADRLISSAEEVWYAGNGSEANVTLNIPAGYSVEIGGEGGDAWSYRILRGDSVKATEYTESPKIRFGCETVTVTGRCDLNLNAGYDSNGRYTVEVRVR